MQKPNKDKHKP